MLKDNISCQHADVKPDNFLLFADDDGASAGENAVGGIGVKLIDFGRTQKLQQLNDVYSDDYVGDKDMMCLGTSSGG